jgi:hypothetical protein
MLTPRVLMEALILRLLLLIFVLLLVVWVWMMRRLLLSSLGVTPWARLTVLFLLVSVSSVEQF